MTRLKAALSHFLISLALSTIVICLLIFGWYPRPYFWALGGLMLLALIIGIDIVLGPLMTLLLFNPRKSRRALALDLSLIAVVQISALGYGLYSGYASRLVFKVFDGKSFQLVQAGDIPSNFLKRTALPEYQSLPFIGQRYAMVEVPDNAQGRGDLAFFGALGTGPQIMTQYYVPLQQGRAQLARAGIAQSVLQKKHPTLDAKVSSLLQDHQLSREGVAVLPFEVKTRTYTAIVRLDPVEVLDVLPEDPR